MGQNILDHIDSEPDNYEHYVALFNFCKNCNDENEAHGFNRELLKRVTKAFRCGNNVENFYNLYKNCLLFEAPVDFDSFMLYIEIDRPPREKFYAPRRKKIKHIVDALQRLADDELDELFISQPPRTGKTTIVMFFLIWYIMKNSEKSNLYSAFSETITGAFYNGVLEVLNDPYTYKVFEVFPDCKVMPDHNKQLKTLNINRVKRYPSLTSRSLYGTLNGSCDCNGLLIADDLIGGIEEALNKDRMISAWSKTTNNLLSRCKEGAKILWIGTRWSLLDPIGLRIESMNDASFEGHRYEIINLPALDENDESLFDYDYNLGFSTEAFKQKRATFEKIGDTASWLAQYQGCPIERDGSVFSADELTYFNGDLPMEEPDLKFMAVDPAFGGGDFVASPVCYKYGDTVYVVDVVFDNADKTHTQPSIVAKAMNYGVTRIKFEANKSTKAYVEETQARFKNEGYSVNCIVEPADNQQRKQDRIFDKAPEIKLHFVFLDGAYRGKEYNMFMQNVYAFSMTGKNKHDDAPDSLAMACDLAFGRSRKAEIFHRPI